MLTLHALAQSRAHRIIWLLESLGLPYALRQYRRDPDTLLAPDTLKAIHPLGKSPILEDDGLVLTESGVIVDYLIQRHGHGQGHWMPAVGTEPYWRYQRWLHYAEASLMPLMLLGLIFNKIDNASMPFFAKPIARKISRQTRSRFIQPQVQLHLRHVERELAGSTWLMGDTISGADIMMSYPLQAAAARFDLQEYSNIRAYLQRIESDPAYIRALRKSGGPPIPTA